MSTDSLNINKNSTVNYLNTHFINHHLGTIQSPAPDFPSSTTHIFNQSVNIGGSDFKLQPITYKKVGGLPHLRLNNSAGADNLNLKLLKPAASLRGKRVTDISSLALFFGDLPSVGIYARVIPS